MRINEEWVACGSLGARTRLSDLPEDFFDKGGQHFHLSIAKYNPL